MTMREDLLNSEDYQSILQIRYGAGVKYVNAEITSLSENVEGFLGEHYKLKVTYDLDGVRNIGKFFIKTRPTATQLQQEMCDTFDSYNKEIFVYEYLLKELNERGIDISFAPKCYLCKDGTTIILEDMSEKDYRISERGQPYNLSQCETLMKSLARYHSGCLIFEEEKSKELGRTFRLGQEHSDILKERMFTKENNSLVLSFFKSSDEIIECIIDELPENDEFKTTFKAQLREIDVFDSFKIPHECRKTIGHGDLWSNNMMFQTKNDLSQECCLLDFQLLRYFHPGYDISLALFENSDVSFRRKYWDYLVHYYYGCFSEELRLHGYSAEEIMPLNVFKSAVEAVEYIAMYHALGAHTFINMPKSYLTDSVAGGDEAFNKNIHSSRVKIILNFFSEVEAFRRVLTDDVYELHRILQKQSAKKTSK